MGILIAWLCILQELRKKNWTLAESLESAENTAASVKLLEAEIDNKTSRIHELKALNTTLKEANAVSY